MNEKFISLRSEYPRFFYNSYSLTSENNKAVLTFDFEIEGLCRFCPRTEISLEGFELFNSPESPEAQGLAFAVGMAEIVSYWKCTCSPTVTVRCGALDSDDILWWKKLWWGGLGEFFFVNGVDTDFDSFVSVVSEKDSSAEGFSFNSSGKVLVPVGGGKDSDVTLSLLESIKDRVKCFTVNDQPARTQAVIAAGLSESDILKVHRKIDSELLARNAEGFLNGHTPFSSVVAFLGALSAFFIGAEHIALSNESSANESSVHGTAVNHQYSKSFEFERDFDYYVKKHFGGFVKYFSLLRPFNELQIAKMFASLPQYHAVFRSCNAGSKKNIWCLKCAKCLFVFVILSPFLSLERLTEIFGENLFEKEEMRPILDELCGLGEKKPFECVGTVNEVNAALKETKRRILLQGGELPLLLRGRDFSGDISPLLNEYNCENNIPSDFVGFAKEMYSYVKSAD